LAVIVVIYFLEKENISFISKPEKSETIPIGVRRAIAVFHGDFGERGSEVHSHSIPTFKNVRFLKNTSQSLYNEDFGERGCNGSHYFYGD
jgi:hypothetical protein